MKTSKEGPDGPPSRVPVQKHKYAPKGSVTAGDVHRFMRWYGGPAWHSISWGICRKFNISYPRALALVLELEQQGLVRIERHNRKHESWGVHYVSKKDRKAGIEPRTAPKPMLVYVIQAGESGPLKIGVSDDPAARMVRLQVGQHEDLRLVHQRPGAFADEARLHRLLAAHRIRGEWFHNSAEVRRLLGIDG